MAIQTLYDDCTLLPKNSVTNTLLWYFYPLLTFGIPTYKTLPYWTLRYTLWL